MKRTTRKEVWELTDHQAAALHWFIDHLSFEDYRASVPPHLPKATCTERAYEIRDALSALQKQLPSARSGDWMYRQEAPARPQANRDVDGSPMSNWQDSPRD